MPLIPTVGKTDQGLADLIRAIADVSNGLVKTLPHRIERAAITELADELQRTAGSPFRDDVAQSIYADAEEFARRAVSRSDQPLRDIDQIVDCLLTSPITGLPIMGPGLAAVFWLTVAGANYPSQLFATLHFGIEDQAISLFVLYRAILIAAPAGGVIWLMRFSLLHNRCTTTFWTIWAATRSKKWTIVDALMPLGIAFAVAIVMARGSRLCDLF